MEDFLDKKEPVSLLASAAAAAGSASGISGLHGRDQDVDEDQSLLHHHAQSNYTVMAKEDLAELGSVIESPFAEGSVLYVQNAGDQMDAKSSVDIFLPTAPACPPSSPSPATSTSSCLSPLAATTSSSISHDAVIAVSVADNLHVQHCNSVHRLNSKAYGSSSNNNGSDPFALVAVTSTSMVMTASPLTTPTTTTMSMASSSLTSLSVLPLVHSADLVYTLDAPTSALVRRGEDTLTYLNKDQLYTLTLESSPRRDSGHMNWCNRTVTSLLCIQLRDREGNKQDESSPWYMWLSRQTTNRIHVLDVDVKNAVGLVGKVQDIGYNGIRVTWSPSLRAAHIPIAVRCLSTDFTNQKGVKGIPLHIHIDTYLDDELIDRAYCQIKTFCDKGAERKTREEQRRLARQASLYPVQPVQPRTVFSKATSINEPFLFLFPSKDQKPSVELFLQSPSPTPNKAESGLEVMKHSSGSPFQAPMSPPVAPLTPLPVASLVPAAPASCSSSAGKVRVKEKQISGFMDQVKCANFSPYLKSILYQRRSIVIYVKQVIEDLFIPISVIPVDLRGLVQGLTSKYQMEYTEVRFLFKQAARGEVIRIDNDHVMFLNEKTFLMKVLTCPTLFRMSEKDSPIYDIVLCEQAVPFSNHAAYPAVVDAVLAEPADASVAAGVASAPPQPSSDD